MYDWVNRSVSGIFINGNTNVNTSTPLTPYLFCLLKESQFVDRPSLRSDPQVYKTGTSDSRVGGILRKRDQFDLF